MSKKILIIGAMEEELLPLIENLKVYYLGEELGFKYYQRENLFISLNGKDKQYKVDRVGTTISTLNTYLMIQKFNPDIILNIGTAGGRSRFKTRIGDVFINQDIYYHDRHLPFQEYYKYSIKKQTPYINNHFIAKLLNIKYGNFSTGNSFQINTEEWIKIKANKIMVKDMECAAISEVCDMLGKPFIALKSITDYIDSPKGASTFTKNFNFAVEQLTIKSIELINYLNISTGS